MTPAAPASCVPHSHLPARIIATTRHHRTTDLTPTHYQRFVRPRYHGQGAEVSPPATPSRDRERRPPSSLLETPRGNALTPSVAISSPDHVTDDRSPIEQPCRGSLDLPLPRIRRRRQSQHPAGGRGPVPPLPVRGVGVGTGAQPQANKSGGSAPPRRAQGNKTKGGTEKRTSRLAASRRTLPASTVADPSDLRGKENDRRISCAAKTTKAKVSPFLSVIKLVLRPIM